MERIKVGIVGCGKQAPKHISGLLRIPGTEIVLADKVPHLAAELGRKVGLHWVPEDKELFADPEIKAIDICTPTNSHVELIKRSLESGKDFFCEKPLCQELEAAKGIQEQLENDSRIGMMGYVYRFSPPFELAHSIFADVPNTGESIVLGRVLTAFFRLGGRGGHQVWKHRKADGGGAINEMLVHMIDLAIWFFGPVKEAEILAIATLRPKRMIQGKEEEVDAEDYVLARLKTKSGVEVVCQTDLITPVFTQLLEVQGENGTFMASIQPDMPSFVFCNEAVAGYPAGKTVLNFGMRNLFEAQMAEFIRRVRTRQEPDRCTVKDSILLLEAMNLLRKEKI
jgi:predicted dehydrogenase